MASGRLTKLFPGGNTSKGFYSFYHNIIEDKEANRVFILKGGPGSGKSTFMRKIGEIMLEKGYDVEYHCCSSDNDSLDGICIPALGMAMIDGTAPHVCDPRNPGAVDEIVHLGDFWDEGKLQAAKEQILQSNYRISRLFQTAYHHLAEAKIIREELDSYLEEAVFRPRLHEITAEIIGDMVKDAPVQYEREPKDRHLFATAFTPRGQWHHFDTILQDIKKIYLVTGEASGLISQIVGAAAQAAHAGGLDTAVFHCALEPEKIDLVLIPQQECAVMKDIQGIYFKVHSVPSITEVKLYNLDQYLNESVLRLYANEIDSAKKRLFAAMTRAIDYIAKAKAEHDRLESFYIPAMNFDALNEKGESILARMLSRV